MAEQTPRTLNHLCLFAFTDAYWHMNEHAKAAFHEHWLAGLSAAAVNFDIYQSTDTRADLLVWCALNAEEPGIAASFFEKQAIMLTPYRHLIRPVQALWGFTRPSQYTKVRSDQEVDPFSPTRMQYLVAYPFTKTAEWYRLGKDARQGMMNEHIRIGKQYEDIKQLLLYSFGLQDYEFVVVYETEDLVRFSELVNELRNTEARAFTLADTPVFTAIYHPAQETLALWK